LDAKDPVCHIGVECTVEQAIKMALKALKPGVIGKQTPIPIRAKVAIKY